MEAPLGLYDVRPSEGAEAKDIQLDIVAVHGLGGHAFNTWTHPGTGTCWVRDLLPDKLPGTRTMVFGYNAKRINHNAEVDFRDVAGQLIAGLSRLRASAEEQSRPIIFLAHSLGGLIVKKAVTLTDNQAKTIASCTRAFVFFATPHCGSSFADLAVVFQRLTKLILDVPNNFLRELCTKSPELKRLHFTFKAILENKNVRCISFYEGLKSKRALFSNSYIVTRESAVLDIEGEEQIMLNADHSSIIRYKNTGDDNFKVVISILQTLVNNITKPQPIQRRQSSTQLFVPFRPGKYYVGRTADLATLESLFLGRERPLCKTVALYGLSGVGKTQLALKFAIEYQDRYNYIFFVNASSLEILRNDFIKLQKNLDLADGTGDALAEMTNWLVSQNEHTWLLVFDNANDLRGILPVITPIVHAGHVILTTQDACVEENEFISEALQVKALTPEEAKELLFKRSGIKSPKPYDIEVADALVAELGHVPLAIDSAGAYINVHQKSVKEYADLLHKYQRQILDHRPQVSSYERSVIGSLELNLKEIDSKLGAYHLLCLLVFLDRTEVTEEFLKRGVTTQRRWGSLGEPIQVDPTDRYVPEQLIELINNDLEFDEAVKDLISLSIITCTKRDPVGRVFTLHVLYHKCAKLRMTKDQRRTYSADALCFLAHAFPSDEYVLENRNGTIGRSYIPHIYYAYDSFRYPYNDLSISYLESFAKPLLPFTPCEVVVNMILNADIMYGEGNELKNKVFMGWAEELLGLSSSLLLKARALEVRLAIGFYESGNYDGGIQAAKAFLLATKDSLAKNPVLLNELTNSQIGVIQVTLAELLVTEVSVDENFEESLALLRGWSPLTPGAPSAKEKITLGIRGRALGKVFKDHGDWKECELELKDYLSTYAVKGSQYEGWAAGDLAHVCIEMNRFSEAEDILLKYLEPRQISQSPKERSRDRRSDTMYLEMQLGECLLSQGKMEEAEERLQELLTRFRSFGVLGHFEKFRVFFILTALARLRHLTNKIDAALAYWRQALEYSITELDKGNQKGKWGRSTYFPSIVLLSIAHCQFRLGNEKQALELQHEARDNLHDCASQPWVLGLGSYWLNWLNNNY